MGYSSSYTPCMDATPPPPFREVLLPPPLKGMLLIAGYFQHFDSSRNKISNSYLYTCFRLFKERITLSNGQVAIQRIKCIGWSTFYPLEQLNSQTVPIKCLSTYRAQPRSHVPGPLSRKFRHHAPLALIPSLTPSEKKRRDEKKKKKKKEGTLKLAVLLHNASSVKNAMSENAAGIKTARLQYNI